MVNPTQKTQERIIGVIENSEYPISISSIAKDSKISFYSVKSTINFLEKLGIIRIIRSSGGTSLIIKLKGIKNASTTIATTY